MTFLPVRDSLTFFWLSCKIFITQQFLIPDLILNSDIIFDGKKSSDELIFELQQDIIEEEEDDDDECEYLLLRNV